MEIIYLTQSIDGHRHFDTGEITACLQGDERSLVRGTEFTGRIDTRVFTNSQLVAKIKSFKGHSDVATQRWIEKRRRLEMELEVYPPEKAWFLVKIGNDVYPGNVTWRRDTLYKIAKDRQRTSREDFTGLLVQQYELVLRTAAQAGKTLDMGLTNFVLGRCGSLYYVDDDLYSWDRFVTFGHLLSTQLREYGLHRLAAKQLGSATRRLICKYFDCSWAAVLEEKLADTFVPESLTACYAEFTAALKGAPAATVTPNELEDCVALLGDIHSNLEALDAVLQDIERRKITSAIVLGDVVGYGPNPEECVARLRELPFHFICGNHDLATALGKVGKGFSKSARWAIEWTLGQVSDESRRWLGSLDYVLKAPDYWAVHGAPMDPTFLNAYVYESTYTKNLDFMQQREIPLCFHGHTHIAGAYIRHRGVPDHWTEEQTLSLSAHERVILSPGSVGLPRNRSATAQYAIWCRSSGTVQFIRVDYDVRAVVAKMQGLGFPDFVSRHLFRLLEQAPS
ncbi:metallophosphoesterase [Proteobacteria bacterium 005FR1]|nr:metallophosphoesterase [Proteobacteria bacterium 005FR1]